VRLRSTACNVCAAGDTSAVRQLLCADPRPLVFHSNAKQRHLNWLMDFIDRQSCDLWLTDISVGCNEPNSAEGFPRKSLESLSAEGQVNGGIQDTCLIEAESDLSTSVNTCVSIFELLEASFTTNHLVWESLSCVCSGCISSFATSTSFYNGIGLN